MAFLDDARRWVRDRFSSDEYINGTAKEHLANALASLPSMSHKERQHSIDHVTAYSEYYYRHHGEVVPGDMRQQLSAAGKRVEQLNALDSAREVLKQYGGPPSKYTVSESLERSAKELAQRQRPDRSAQREKREQSQRQSVRVHV